MPKSVSSTIVRSRALETKYNENHFGQTMLLLAGKEVMSHTHLPHPEPPCLSVPPQVWDDLNKEQMFRIGNADDDGRGNDPQQQSLGDGRVGESRGQHDEW